MDDVELGPARPWLFGVARRTLANAHRGRRRRVDLALAFQQLKPRDQEALALVAWDGLTTAEAARVLGISASAFSVRLSRARRRLRKHLEPAEGGR